MPILAIMAIKTAEIKFRFHNNLLGCLLQYTFKPNEGASE